MKSDSELIVDFRRGDYSAFKRLVRRHYVSLTNFFRALSSDPLATEALVASTFVHISVDAQLLRPRMKFSAYLYRTAVSCWRSYRKANPGAQAAPLSLTGNSVLSNDAPPSDAAPNDILRLLENLPEESELLIVLKEITHLNYQEIAGVLDTPQENVKDQLSEAYGGLRPLVKARPALLSPDPWKASAGQNNSSSVPESGRDKQQG